MAFGVTVEGCSDLLGVTPAFDFRAGLVVRIEGVGSDGDDDDEQARELRRWVSPGSAPAPRRAGGELDG